MSGGDGGKRCCGVLHRLGLKSDSLCHGQEIHLHTHDDLYFVPPMAKPSERELRRWSEAMKCLKGHITSLSLQAASLPHFPNPYLTTPIYARKIAGLPASLSTLSTTIKRKICSPKFDVFSFVLRTRCTPSRAPLDSKSLLLVSGARTQCGASLWTQEL